MVTRDEISSIGKVKRADTDKEYLDLAEICAFITLGTVRKIKVSFSGKRLLTRIANF